MSAPAAAREWRDVTDEFFRTCAAMGPGQYASRPSFDLHRAISAIELFSPKMDAGLVAKRAPALLFADLSEADVLAIYNRLSALELAYYEGVSGAESIMTCLFCHQENLDALEDSPMQRCLRALVFSVLRPCSEALTMVNFTRFFFEEEFFLGGNLGLHQRGDDVTFDEVLAMLNAIPAISPAIDARLEFAKAWNNANKHLRGFDYKQAQQALNLALKCLDRIDATRPMEMTELALKGFDPLINFHLLLPQPPRPPLAEKLEANCKSSEEWRTVLLAGLALCSMAHELALPTATMSSAFESITPFAELNASSIVRAHAMCSLCVGESKLFFGKHPWSHLITADIASLCPPNAAQGFSQLDNGSLMTTSSRLFFDLFRVMFASRARRRRQLVHRMEEWGSYSQTIEVADAKRLGVDWTTEASHSEARQAYLLPLGCWALQWCARLMTMYISMGAELELYSPGEATSVAVYQLRLYRILAEIRAASLQRWNPKNPSVPQLPFEIRSDTLIDARRYLFLGTMQMLVVIYRRRILHGPNTEAALNSARLVFEHRFFDAFSTIWLPTAVHYNDIAMIMLAQLTDVDEVRVIESATMALNQAKTFCARQIKLPCFSGHPMAAKLKEVAKAAVVNSLALARLTNKQQPPSSCALEFTNDGLVLIRLG